MRNALPLAAVFAAALALAACGRNGAPGLPPSATAAPPPPASASPAKLSADGSIVTPTAQETAIKNGFDAQGNPVAQPGQKRPFLLDPLLQ